MNEPFPIEPITPGRAITVQSNDPSPLSLIARMVESGQMSHESVAVVKELVALKEHMEDRDAERQFAAAFSDLQAELGTFRATKIVPDKQGNARYTYLPYEEIMSVVRPLAETHGFSISFSSKFVDGRILQVCTIQHRAGYHRDYEAYVRPGSGPYGASETQADGAAMTYAKRYALCNALNITVEHDTDARNEGGPITQEQADTLQGLVLDIEADEAKFLRYAGAKTYLDIGSNRYQELYDLLVRKAKARQ